MVRGRRGGRDEAHGSGERSDGGGALHGDAAGSGAGRRGDDRRHLAPHQTEPQAEPQRQRQQRSLVAPLHDLDLVRQQAGGGGPDRRRFAHCAPPTPPTIVASNCHCAGVATPLPLFLTDTAAG